MLRFIKEELLYIWNHTEWFSRLFVIALSFMVLGFLPSIPMAHLPFVAIAAFLCFLKRSTVETVPALLVLFLPLTIVIGDPDPVFRSWQRYFLFLVVFLFVSPLFGGVYSARLRRSVLFAYLGFSTFVALGSFICYYLGVNYMRSNVDGMIVDYHYYTSSFGGLTTHSMVLGPLSGIGAMYLFYRFLNRKGFGKVFLIVAIIVCLVTCLFAASRSALLAAISGGLIMLYISSPKKSNFILALFTIVLVGMLTLPLWENATRGITNKQQANEELGRFGSRTSKWEARIDEFKQNPVTGIGFAAVDPLNYDEYDSQTGNIEPGSSWLTILSMTGMLGFLLFLGIIIKPIRSLRKHPSPYNALVMGLLVFLLVHMIAEGYIYAGGGVSCFRAWLFIGCAYDQIYDYFEE